MATTTLTYSDLILRFPEFTTTNTTEQTRINLFIQDAAPLVNSTHFGDLTDRVILLKSCHNLTMANRGSETGGGGAGAVTAMTRGEHIVSYSVPVKNDGYENWRATPYGQQYLTILFQLDLSPLVSTS